ncbi:PREDICTED: bifunctional heparan sulfate N-deacetylase/N-sulfotransferase-like [Vollenhovia emeryi]|uniref:bifunctional heparan sulfate N-deacetylase/N-sulfotransferase-like n=1 Tax=Vollenhovia emeryi TaxID=411798 RepID=UPI0005F36691|nr:PREDICTED: bifunctional heparan sulfate N-deacetylase/N-sulfotransferase-like [Vollenhovia emeryi]XP_011863613.1 PREDICTED: bifunctional heparan sulfate N-deacetylase/N-sulfotransferase-like [Vollenhovia emeryi]
MVMKISASEAGVPLLGAVGPRYVVKQATVKRCVLALLLVSIASIFYYTHYIISSGPLSSLIHRDTRPEPAIRCSTLRGATRLPSAPDHRSEARLRIDPKVLVFVETLYSRLGREIAELLVYNRIKRGAASISDANAGETLDVSPPVQA